MEFFDVINKRGSIRKYIPNKMVEEEKINAILNAGFCAPSALNKRPYHFIVISDRNVINDIATTSVGKKVALGAPILIAVCGDLNIQDKMEFVMNDTSACIQNMLLTITDLGLGGCWLGQRRDVDDEVNKMLNLPEGVFVSGFIAVGYPAEEKYQKDRFDRNKVHINKW